MPPNYKYSFFDSFDASPALNLLAGAHEFGMTLLDVEPSACMMAPSNVFFSGIQIMPSEVDDQYVYVRDSNLVFLTYAAVYERLKSSDEIDSEIVVKCVLFIVLCQPLLIMHQ
jgi:hypothetical protein